MSSAAVDLVCEIGARLRQTNLLVSARVTRNINEEMDKTLTFGQRVADRFAAEQDFKVNLKSELMLGELTRMESVRGAQMEELISATQVVTERDNEER